MQTFNLAEIAGLDTTQVAEVRLGEKFPAGLFDWEIQIPEMTDDKVNVEGVDLQRLLCKLPVKCINVVSLKEPLDEKSTNALLSKTFPHTIVRTMKEGEKDLETFVGMIKAFLVDTGCEGSGKLVDLLQKAQLHRFRAPVEWSRNKNDEDNPYVNLRVNKAKPLPKVA